MKPLRALCGGELPRLVMFDLDGTLIDSVPDLAEAVNRTLLDLGRKPVGADKVREWVGNGARVLVRRALADDLDHASVDEAQAEDALARFLDIYADCHHQTVLYPGVRELLEALSAADIELAVVTNKPERFVAPLLEQVELGGYFRWIIGGDTLPQQKPDPAALLQVMRLAGVTARQAVFVGDSRSDVLAARAAGVACVAVSYGYNHGRPIGEERPELVVDNLAHVLRGKWSLPWSRWLRRA